MYIYILFTLLHIYLLNFIFIFTFLQNAVRYKTFNSFNSINTPQLNVISVDPK